VFITRVIQIYSYKGCVYVEDMSHIACTWSLLSGTQHHLQPEYQLWVHWANFRPERQARCWRRRSCFRCSRVLHTYFIVESPI